MSKTTTRNILNIQQSLVNLSDNSIKLLINSGRNGISFNYSKYYLKFIHSC